MKGYCLNGLGTLVLIPLARGGKVVATQIVGDVR
jgi:hypothetical protein